MYGYATRNAYTEKKAKIRFFLVHTCLNYGGMCGGIDNSSELFILKNRLMISVFELS